MQDNVLPDYRKEVKRFIDRYQKEHESLLEKLFGGMMQPKESADKKEKADPDKKQWKK